MHAAGGGTTLHAPKYHLLPIDMRVAPAHALAPALDPILSPSLPTLLLFECVLAYMTPEASDAVIQWFIDYFSSATNASVLGGIVYEMFGLRDSFGKVMLNNLKVNKLESNPSRCSCLCSIAG